MAEAADLILVVTGPETLNPKASRPRAGRAVPPEWETHSAPDVGSSPNEDLLGVLVKRGAVFDDRGRKKSTQPPT